MKNLRDLILDLKNKNLPPLYVKSQLIEIVSFFKREDIIKVFVKEFEVNNSDVFMLTDLAILELNEIPMLVHDQVNIEKVDFDLALAYVIAHVVSETSITSDLILYLKSRPDFDSRIFKDELLDALSELSQEKEARLKHVYLTLNEHKTK